MKYILQLGDKDIDLDSSLTLEERIKFCEDIIEKYPQYFQYRLPKDYNDYTCASYKVKYRLEQLGTYILLASNNNIEFPVQTDYKTRIVRNSESNFNLFE